VTPVGGSTLPSVALVVSSLAVLGLAVGFDVLADEAPTHTLTVALAAAIVGLGRFWLRGRLSQVFTAMNLVVIGQPAVHALTKLTHAGADALPHSHVVPEDASAVALHVVVALLVVTIAASEPACTYVATRIVRTLVVLTRAPRPADRPSPVRPQRWDEPPALEQQQLRGRCSSRRGPPLVLALAG
jgi:lysylphosphatidylglycerol synthetase-like protein (DUF2156 family)